MSSIRSSRQSLFWRFVESLVGTKGATAVCRCPGCGYTQAHTRGIPCSMAICPRCALPLHGSRCQ